MIRNLRIKANDAQRWEHSTSTESDGELRALAAEMVTALIASIPRRCFVVMPFQEDYSALYDFVICPAIEEVGDQPIRLDRAAVPGDVIKQIADGVAVCEYAIIVLDGLRPNVLYELGLLHGHGKATILMNRSGADAELKVPFDVTTQQRIEYKVLDRDLPRRLVNAIHSLHIRR
jgi:hypothetical protein